MKIFSAVLVQYATIETGIGAFKVFSDGHLLRWRDFDSEWAWFDEDKYKEEDLTAIKEAGLKLMK